MRASVSVTLLSAVSVLVPHMAAAQETATIVGLVTDSAGQPLRDVLVFIDDGVAATRTDQLGLFGLFSLPRERHALGYLRSGFAPRSFELDLSTGPDYRDVGVVALAPGGEPTAVFMGRVTDGDGGPGLAGAIVEINGRVVAETDQSGAFTAPATSVVWGANELTVRHRAFADRSMTDRIWVSNMSETFDLAVAMGVDPIPLPGVAVEVQSRVLAANGFYERQERIRSGVFLTREEIAERSPRGMGDVVARMLGVATSRSGRDTGSHADSNTGAPVAATSFGRAEDGRPCVPLIFLDGLRMGDLEAPAGVRSGLDQLVHPDDVEGVEIYDNVSGLPPRFSPIGAACGVVLIWTR
jgi:hypothetical protein